MCSVSSRSSDNQGLRKHSSSDLRHMPVLQDSF